MPAEIKIALDTRNLARFRTLYSANKLIAAQSLTYTAERAQTAWRAGQSVFHRRNSWIDKGVRIRAATPGHLEAKVGTIDRYMGRHVKGVGEDKIGGDGDLLVPAYTDIGAVGTHRRIRAMLNRADASSRKPFIIMGRMGQRELVQRTSKERSPLKVLAFLRHRVKIEPRLDAERIVGETVQRDFSTVYERLILAWSAKN